MDAKAKEDFPPSSLYGLDVLLHVDVPGGLHINSLAQKDIQTPADDSDG